MTRWWSVVALCVGLSACAGNPTPTQEAVFAEQTATALAAAQDTEIQFHRAGQISAADHRAWQLGFKSFAQGLQIYTQAVRAKDPVKASGAYQVMARILADLAVTLVPNISDAKARATLQIALDAISAVLSQWTATVRMTWTPPRLAPSFVLASN